MGCTRFCHFCHSGLEKAGAALREMLDARADKIRTELSEAEALRKEAKAQLDSFKGLKKEAEEEAKNILANATSAAKRIRKPQRQKQKRILTAAKPRLRQRLKPLKRQWLTRLKPKQPSLQRRQRVRLSQKSWMKRPP